MVLAVGADDLFDRAFVGRELTFTEQEQVLILGAEIYGLEGINALYFYFKEVTPNQQAELDEYIKILTIGIDPAVIPGLPKTSLTEGEFARVNEIMKFKIGGLWQRALELDRTLKTAELKQITLAGRELLGVSKYENQNVEVKLEETISIGASDVDNYKAFFSNIGLTEEQQKGVDKAARRFIAENELLTDDEKI